MALSVACGSSQDAAFSGPGDLGGGGGASSSGAFGNGGAGNGASDCTPKTCGDQKVECGPAGDGCGGVIRPTGQECGYNNVANFCGGPGLPK